MEFEQAHLALTSKPHSSNQLSEKDDLWTLISRIVLFKNLGRVLRQQRYYSLIH